MKFYLIFILFPIFLFGQEAPYYKKPENRTSISERRVIPNLKASETMLFVFAGAGLNFPKSHVPNNSGYIGLNNSFNSFFDFGLGINKNYDWKLSIAYNQFSIYQNCYLQLPVFAGQRLISYNEKIVQIPFEYSRRIVYLNKVSKAAFLNFNLGLNYFARNFKKENESKVLTSLLSNQKLDTLNVFSSNYSSKPSFSLSGGLEIGGKIIKIIDIGVIYKLNFKPNGIMETDIELTDNHNFNKTFKVIGNNFYSQIELKLIWNIEVLQKFEKHY